MPVTMQRPSPTKASATNVHTANIALEWARKNAYECICILETMHSSPHLPGFGFAIGGVGEIVHTTILHNPSNARVDPCEGLPFYFFHVVPAFIIPPYSDLPLLVLGKIAVSMV